MTFSNTPYDAVGIAIVKELFEQVDSIYPVNDTPAPTAVNLVKRLAGLVSRPVNVPGDSPCGDEIPAAPASNGC